jgi:hypothetical protein
MASSQRVCVARARRAEVCLDVSLATAAATAAGRGPVASRTGQTAASLGITCLAASITCDPVSTCSDKETQCHSHAEQASVRPP